MDLDFNGRCIGERLQWAEALLEEEELPETYWAGAPCPAGDGATWGARRDAAAPPDLAAQDLSQAPPAPAAADAEETAPLAEGFVCEGDVGVCELEGHRCRRRRRRREEHAEGV